MAKALVYAISRKPYSVLAYCFLELKYLLFAFRANSLATATIAARVAIKRLVLWAIHIRYLFHFKARSALVSLSTLLLRFPATTPSSAAQW
jgi:hypothetical protein